MHREIEAARLRRQDEHNRDIVHAWHVVAIYASTRKHGRLPDVKRLLSQSKEQGGGSQQTVGQLRSALALLSAQYGPPVKWGPTTDTAMN